MNPAPAIQIPAVKDRPATPVPFGVQAETGHLRPPIPPLPDTEVKTDLPQVQARGQNTKVLSIIPTLRADVISQAGWGVVFASDADPAVVAALDLLISHRKQQVGNDDRFKVFTGALGVQPGESAVNWLDRQGTSLAPVDPDNGVPYHLMIVGSPERIPFEFQYTLDVQWSVGRLDFDTPAEYAAYAKNVVDYETAATVAQSKTAALWMPANGDMATNLLCNDVGLPFLQKPLGQKQGFALTTFLGNTATKANLAGILAGKVMPNGVPPALLFTGSHGLEVSSASADQRERQGALVCQEWHPGDMPVTGEQTFAGSDVPLDSKLNGIIHIMFACFGGGCPQTDNYPESGAGETQIAPNPMISRLPQSLLTRGALAVIGHIDRAWSFSFQSGSATPQNKLLRSVIECVLLGFPVGMAMDFTNGQWGALASQLGIVTGPTAVTEPNPATLTNLVIARDDARNYILLGDPAVRLRIDKMA